MFDRSQRTWFPLASVASSKTFNDVECVVYCIRNRVNEKLYVGKTKRSLRSRMRGHLEGSKNLDKKSQPLSHAIAKHGIDQFEVTVVHQGTTDQEIKDIEEKLIAEWNTLIHNNRGYNVRKNDTYGGIPKPIEQYDLRTGETIREYKSYSDAYNTSGINNISQCCNGKLKNAGGFGWRFKTSSDTNRGKWSLEKRDRMSQRMLIDNPNDHAVEQLDMDGNFIQAFTSIKKAHDATNVANISSACRGIRKSAGGFKWRYATDRSIVHGHEVTNVT